MENRTYVQLKDLLALREESVESRINSKTVVNLFQTASDLRERERDTYVL